MMTASDIAGALVCLLCLLPPAVVAVMLVRAPWGSEDAQGFRRIKKG